MDLTNTDRKENYCKHRKSKSKAFPTCWTHQMNCPKKDCQHLCPPPEHIFATAKEPVKNMTVNKIVNHIQQSHSIVE